MAHDIVLYGRDGCHLCELARADVARIAADLKVPWQEVDVDTDPDLRAEYGDRVPVITVDGAEHGYGRVEEARLRRALA
jgi:hypothetical protein